MEILIYIEDSHQKVMAMDLECMGRVGCQDTGTLVVERCPDIHEGHIAVEEIGAGHIEKAVRVVRICCL